MRIARSLSLMLVLLVVLPLWTADAQLKKRVAVGRFEDRTGSGYHSLGEGVADMLITALVKSGKFSVLERQEIERVMQEQKFGEMVTPETAPKVGQLLGVELFVIGSVTEFGVKDSKVSLGLSAFGGGVSKKTSRAVVDVRLVNTTTGEILASETYEGEESTHGLSVSVSDIDFSNLGSWSDTDIGKATREAVDGCAELITENMGKVEWGGKVLRVNADGTILIKPGSEGNVEPGMDFMIVRMGEDIKDPDTGLSLGAEEEKIGEIEIVEDALKGKAAKAKVTEGKGVKVGDLVREKK
jgi:curli biogenesis system outer membrane secretion channel CsgG